MSKLPGSDKLPTRPSGKLQFPGGFGKLPAGFGKPCKAPGRLINQEPHEKRCKEPYKVTPSAKPTFRAVRGHKIYRSIRCLRSVQGAATTQALFREVPRSFPAHNGYFIKEKQRAPFRSQKPHSWASRSSGATPHAPSYETGQAWLESRDFASSLLRRPFGFRSWDRTSANEEELVRP